jgi:hypothetical protein
MTGRGYRDGDQLRSGEQPWPTGWEQDPRVDDGHAHDWERVLLPDSGVMCRRSEYVVRCAVCHAPRCSPSTSADPCMERRHHHDLHIHLSGGWRPIGDRLPQ